VSKETKYSNYNRLLEQAREAGASTARAWIPKLCQALREEDKNLSNEDIRDRVEKDCAYIWSKSTIRTYIPDEFKDPQKQEAGRKGREKQLEKPISAGGARETGAENSSVPSKVQESESFDRPRQDMGVGKEMYEKLQRQFKNRLEFETKYRDDIIKQQSQEIQKLNQEIQKLRELIDSQTIHDIPQLVDNKIGPVKVQNLSKINKFERRGFQILASRSGEIVRRKLVEQGKVTINFYILSKDRTTNIESLVPVDFKVDMMGKTTELILDESRL
jgi:hypothetical protein